MWQFMVAGKPVFGICRGHQLIFREYLFNAADTKLRKNSQKTVENVLSFEQHISDHDCANSFHLWRKSAHHYVEGRVDFLYNDEQYERDRVPVNSMHHQAAYAEVDMDKLRRNNKIGPHFRVMAWTNRGLDAEQEGVVIESFLIEGWSKSLLMGVQWHPEELRDLKLLQTFFGRFEAPKAAKTASVG
jgi:gamma-glutamyl-gamma-aminobutyrate hydrolase PuuD